MPNATILVVDDEQLIRWSLAERLRADGLRRRRGGDRPARRSSSVADGVDLVLLDYKLPDIDGVTVLRRIKEHDPDILVILLTAYATRRHRGRGDEDRRLPLRQQAVQPRRRLADWSPRRSRRRSCAARCAMLRAEPGAALRARPHRRRVAGDGRRCATLLRKVATSPASTVLLTGESGTGKDLAAKVLHFNSERAQPAVREHHLLGAFPRRCSRASCSATSGARSPTRGSRSAACSSRPTAAPCSSTRSARWCRRCRPSCCASSKRRRSSASAGRTTSRSTCASSPRPTATSKSRCRAGHFREDLYYRLNVLPIALPPLRAHLDDVPALVSFYVDLFNREFRKNVRGASPDGAARRCSAYGWPGNIRELRNAVERAMLLAEGAWLEPQDFPVLAARRRRRTASRCRPRASISRSSSAAWSSRRSSAAAATRRGRPRCSA